MQAPQFEAPEDTDRVVLDFIARSGLVASDARCMLQRLTGGVSSDIWLAEKGGWHFCVKRALPKLKVAAEWFAPVERNANEAAWFAVVGRFLPDAVPKVLAEDAPAGVFAMEYLPEADYPNWKRQLRDGIVSIDAAAEVGQRLARVHSVTAAQPDLRTRFASDAIFHAIRLEPYLLATAHAHPALASRLRQLADVTAETKLALVHGDVSPKNILMGPLGPVFLDAECAWWGDPAFDLAFCLNHLLLKCLWVAEKTSAYLAAYRALVKAYLVGVDWEPADVFERRASALLPGLFLARVDGKSPVEYVTRDREKDRVRRVAGALLREPVERLDQIAEAWSTELQKDVHGRNHR